MEREIKSPILFHAFKSLHYFVIKYREPSSRYSCIRNTRSSDSEKSHRTPPPPPTITERRANVRCGRGGRVLYFIRLWGQPWHNGDSVDWSLAQKCFTISSLLCGWQDENGDGKQINIYELHISNSTMYSLDKALMLRSDGWPPNLFPKYWAFVGGKIKEGE